MTKVFVLVQIAAQVYFDEQNDHKR